MGWSLGMLHGHGCDTVPMADAMEVCTTCLYTFRALCPALLSLRTASVLVRHRSATQACDVVAVTDGYDCPVTKVLGSGSLQGCPLVYREPLFK